MGDILPYSCIFPDCSISQKLFDSRHEWYGHLQMEHKVFNPERGEVAESTPRIGTQDPNTFGPSNCVLCEEPLRSSQKFERHVARHLQELALYVLPRDDYDDEDEILDDPPQDDYFDDSTSIRIHQAGLVETTQSTTYQSVAPSDTGEQSSTGVIAKPTAPDTQEIGLGSEVDSEPSHVSREDVAAPKEWKTTFRMVLHLHDISITRIAKLDTGVEVDLVSNRVANDLDMKMKPYHGEDFMALGGRMRPLGQLTLDWHVIGKEKTYTTTFLVVEAEEFDVLLGDKTIGEITFYNSNDDEW